MYISLQRSRIRERVVTQYHSEVGYSPSLIIYSWLHSQLLQVPRSRDLANFVPTTTTVQDKHTYKLVTLPLVHAYKVKIQMSRYRFI